MAITILVAATLIVASVNAAFVWQDDDNFANKPEFKFQQPKFPAFPTFPTFRPMTFPTFTFPTMPPMRPMVFLTPEDIAKNKGPNYNGVSVSSSSSSTVGKDGKVIQTGGATIVTNNGGVVKKYEIGDDPSQVNVVTVSSQG